MDQVSRSTPKWYTALVLALIGFGMLGILSIGFPFLLVGLTLAALRSYRQRPSVFWPILALVVGFLVGYALIAPFSCSVSVSAEVGTTTSTTTPELCESLLGITYTDSALAPGLIAGLTLALGASAATAGIVRRNAAHTPPPAIP